MIRPTALILLMCPILGLSFAQPVVGYSPDHPEVVEMVDRAVAYLRSAPVTTNADQNIGGAVGDAVMMAYAVYKVHHDKNDPVVKRGVQYARQLAASITRTKQDKHSKINYQASVAIILLCEVDRKAYKAEITRMASFILGFQKPHGGFGYFSEQEGDNSQTQYVVLAMWTMQKKGFEVPGPRMEKAVQYLLSVQDPKGAWAYKTKKIGTPNALINQGRITHTMLAAGAGSCLIGGDFFEFYKGADKPDEDSGLPPAVKKFNEEEDIEVKAKSAQRVTPEMIAQAKNRAMGYLRSTPYPYQTHTWTYYALYCFERFHSFRELAEGSAPDEPEWYNQGVLQLKKLQTSSGAWPEGGYVTPQVATSLSVLFLIRGTKRALQEMNEGTMSGGQGLPKDTKDMRAKGAQIVGKPVAEDASTLINLLASDDGADLDEKVIPDNLRLASDPVKRADQITRLKRMIKGGPWQARRAAARLLGQSSDLDIVPSLIFGLTDQDTVVRREARNGLRFISRKFEGFGMPDNPSEVDIQNAVKAWKDWYLRVNPSYVFLGY